MKFLDHFPDAYILHSTIENNQYIWIPQTATNGLSENELWECSESGELLFEGLKYRQLKYDKHSNKFNLILDNFSEIVSGNHSWKLIRQFKMA